MMEILQRQVDGAVSRMVDENDSRNVSNFVQSVRIDEDGSVMVIELLYYAFSTLNLTVCKRRKKEMFGIMGSIFHNKDKKE